MIFPFQAQRPTIDGLVFFIGRSLGKAPGNLEKWDVSETMQFSSWPMNIFSCLSNDYSTRFALEVEIPMSQEERYSLSRPNFSFENQGKGFVGQWGGKLELGGNGPKNEGGRLPLIRNQKFLKGGFLGRERVFRGKDLSGERFEGREEAFAGEK